MPTGKPTQVPSEKPTANPTVAPSFAPSTKPTIAPTEGPTSTPTIAPTRKPTTEPSKGAECEDCSDSSKFAKKTDYQGSDLIKGGVKAENASACCTKCNANSQCQYWTYGTSNPAKGTCWLKSSKVGEEPQTNRESGKVCRKAAPVVTKATKAAAEEESTEEESTEEESSSEEDSAGASEEDVAEEGSGSADAGPKCEGCSSGKFAKKMDYQGSDLIKGGVKATSSADCCKKCEGNQKCQYWSYGTVGSMKGTCWLKHNKVGEEPQNNRDSGRVCRKIK
jgi:hypothetical protein